MSIFIFPWHNTALWEDLKTISIWRSRPVTVLTSSGPGNLRKPKELLVSRLRQRPDNRLPARIQPTKFRFGVRNTFDREFTKIRDSFETRKADTILDRLSDFFQPISRLMSQWKWSVNERYQRKNHPWISYESFLHRLLLQFITITSSLCFVDTEF